MNTTGTTYTGHDFEAHVRAIRSMANSSDREVARNEVALMFHALDWHRRHMTADDVAYVERHIERFDAELGA